MRIYRDRYSRGLRTRHVILCLFRALDKGEGGGGLALVTPLFSLRAGWGFDASLPLSAIPRMHDGRTPAGRALWEVGWLGFFFCATEGRALR